MNNNIKKSIYLMMLSSLLLTGCSKENKIEKSNNIYISNNSNNDYNDDHVENDINSDDIAMESAAVIENEDKGSADLENNNSDNLDENSELSINEVDEHKYESILPKEKFKKEEQVIEYFDKLKCDIELLLTVDNEDVADKIEARVMLFVDYMVEDIKIGDYRFVDLDIENQMRIKKIYTEVDNMIEETKPDYKEMLINKSYKFKEFCVDKYNYIKEQVGSWYQDSKLKTSIDNYIEDGIKLYEKYKQENK